MFHLLNPYKLLSLLLMIIGLNVSFLAHAEYTQSSVPFNFNDISGSGEILLEDCDECARAIKIGFPFTYYGRVYTHMYVSSNGFVIPGTSAPLLDNRIACCSGRAIPLDDNIEGIMSLWWVDLSMKAEPLSEALEENGKVYTQLTGTDGSYVYIIQFNQVRHFHNLATNTANTFQLKLFQNDNHLEFHYEKIVANQNFHTIGIESPKQDEGIEFFRGNNSDTIPEGGQEFALSFTPPETVKLTSSLRYAVEESTIVHTFEIDQAIALISDIDIDTFLSTGSLVESIDDNAAVLESTNPARISIPFKIFDTLSETGGNIFADEVDMEVSNKFFNFEAQTVFIQQASVVTDAGASVSAVDINFDQTLEVFKSTANLADNDSKVASALDIFLFFYTDRIQNTFIPYQLSQFGSGIECGAPYIDDNDDYIYLYVLCETGTTPNELVLKRFDLESYINTTIVDTVIDLDSAETQHVFDGNITEQALVVGHNNAYAYAKDDGSGMQNVYFKSASASEVLINTTNGSGTLKSLAMDSNGTKIVYVIDNTVYYYDADITTETLVSNDDVESADISADGTTIVFSSTSNAAGTNADASLEIFTVLSSTLGSANFQQLTNLSVAGEACKLPIISDDAQRVAVVCNADLLALGNVFTAREAVFVIETITGDPVAHLLTNVSDKSTNISRLAMSGNGATLVFEDEDKSNAFRLNGLNSFSSSVEFSASEFAGTKNFPVPFEVPGDGKSGTISIYTIVILLFGLGLRILPSAYGFKRID